MLNLKNKAGGEKLLSIWWFFVLTVVGVGIVIAVLMFYSADVDIRELESEILYERVSDCIVQDGFLVEGIFNKDFDLLKQCNLNEKIFNEDKLLYINIQIFDEAGNNLREVEGGIEEGNSQFPKQCEFQEEGVEAKHYAKCFEKDLIVLYNKEGIKQGKIKILTASNNQGRKIPFIENE